MKRGSKSFIGHSKKLDEVRTAMSESMHNQYLAQGYLEPIDCLISVKFVFYTSKQWEPDLDNLPSIVLDALQGITKKVKKEKVKKWVTLVDDKLVMFEQSEKIIVPKIKGVKDGYEQELRTELEITEYRGES